MIISATGHRIQHLTVFDKGIYARKEDLEALETRMADLARAAIVREGAETVISGVAQGWDTAVAEAALTLGVPLLAAVPFVGQAEAWPEAARRRYESILARASLVHIVTPGAYSASAMYRRNEWMVDRSDKVVALWNGERGGTGSTITYANKVRRPVVNLYSSFVRRSGLDFIKPHLSDRAVSWGEDYVPLVR